MKKFCFCIALCVALCPAIGFAIEFEAESAKFAGHITVGLDGNATEALTTIFDNSAGATVRAFSSTDLTATWGDQLSTVGTGLLSEHTFGVFNSSTGNTFPINTANVALNFYINGSGTFIGGYTGSVTFPGGLAPGFFSTVTFTGLDGLGIDLAPNTDIIVTQELTSFTGGSLRPGIVSRDPIAIGASIPQVYIDASTVGAAGFYNIQSGGVNVPFNLLQTVKTQAAVPVLTTGPANGGTVNIGNVRVGTTGSGSLSATNTGGTGTTLTGNFGTASGEFSGGGGAFSLAQNASTSTTYTYAPATRGADSQPITTTSNGGSSTVNLSGVGVGPVYADDTEAGCVDVGNIYFEGTSTNFFSISNTTSDGDLGGLTDLTITGVTIVDLDGNAIWSTDLAPGTVLAAGESLAVNIFADYAGNPNVSANAQLIIETDEGAALGGDGFDYTIDLCGFAVPEPSSLALGAFGAVALLAAVRRRTR